MGSTATPKKPPANKANWGLGVGAMLNCCFESGVETEFVALCLMSGCVLGVSESTNLKWVGLGLLAGVKAPTGALKYEPPT